MIARALNALGLGRKPVGSVVHVDWEAKFKQAVVDLEKQAKLEVALRIVNDRRADRIADLEAEIAALRPDALLWRNARDKRARKRGKA